MQIAKNVIATIEYALSDTNGAEIDSTENGRPLRYMHGVGQLVPGLEGALEGKRTGDKVDVTVLAADAYGPRDETLVVVVEKDQFDEPDAIEIGSSVQAMGPDGEMILEVLEVSDGQVRLDANHPLAGLDLRFVATVVDVREATEHELRFQMADEDDEDEPGSGD